MALLFMSMMFVFTTSNATPKDLRIMGEWSPRSLPHTARDSQSDLGKIYQTLPALFNETMVLCPEKMWPNYSWKNVNVFLLEPQQPSLVWKGSDNSVNIVADSEIPEATFHGLFDFFEWNGQFALSLNPGLNPKGYAGSVEGLFGLGVHEGFHALGQMAWNSKHGPRGTAYPVDAKPRLYRRHLFDRLFQYFNSKGTDSQSLAHAAYWFERWNHEYPGEALSTTDGYEGTARYVEILAMKYAHLGCSATDEHILNTLIQELPNHIGGAMTPKAFLLDFEGYDLGSLAAFTLQWVDHVKDWQTEMKNGTTPLEVLMAGKASASEAVNASLEAEYLTAAIDMNTYIAGILGSSIEDFQNKSFVRVAMSGAFAAFSPKGFYLPTALPSVTAIPMAQDLKMVGLTDITIKKDTVTFGIDSPCSSPTYFTVLVPKTALNIVDGKLQIMTNGLDGVMAGTTLIDANGFEWFCGVNAN